MQETKLQEKREFVRVERHIPIHFSSHAENGRELSIIRNISVGGMLFESGKLMHKGSRFKFSISLDSTIIPLNGLGEVVWTREKGNVHEIGSKFLRMNKYGREKLISYLEYELQKSVEKQKHFRKLSKEKQGRNFCRTKDIVPFFKGLERNILSLKTFLKKNKDEIDSSNYMPLQANIARQTGSLIAILENSALAMLSVCLTNRITYILIEMGCWRNFTALNPKQNEELETAVSDSLKLLREIQSKIQPPPIQ